MKKKKEQEQNQEQPIQQLKQDKATGDEEQLNWLQIMLLIGKPIWDNNKKKYRIISGYKATQSKITNDIIAEITFTDTLHWEEFTHQKLYTNIPANKEEKKEDGSERSDNEGERTKTKDEK